MTQTPRDWQKDMEMCRNSHMEHYGLADVKDALIHWLQEAKRLKEESSEAVEGLYQIIQRGDLTSLDLDQAEEVFKRFRSTLYPDTPAQEEGK